MNRGEKLISPSAPFFFCRSSSFFFFFYWKVVTGLEILTRDHAVFQNVPLPVSPTVFEIKRQSSYDFYECEIFTAYDSNSEKCVSFPLPVNKAAFIEIGYII